MKIFVYHASAFFHEEGLEVKVMFQLIYNSLLRGYGYAPSICSADENNNQMPNVVSMIETRKFVAKDMQSCFGKIEIDLKIAEERVSKFAKDHIRLKEINSKLDDFGLWDYLFRRRGQLKDLLQERREIEEMTISTAELINIAYYRYYTSTKGSLSKFKNEFFEWMNQ